MIIFEVNQQAGKKIPLKLWRQWLIKIEKALKLKNKPEVSIAVVGDQAVKKLNRIYRAKNQVTDVLSFGEADSSVKVELSTKNYLGEIVICYPQAARQAKKFGHSVNQELELLLIHGFLHLLGYDHEKIKESKVMRKLESEIRNYPPAALRVAKRAGKSEISLRGLPTNF